jgi:hypothetical protein
MTIETVKSQNEGFLVNGAIAVPNDPANRHYQAILDWINEGNTPEGPDVIEPDYVALRTGPDGYASVGEQLGMQTDGTWDAHIADVKARFPKTITGGTTIGDVPTEIMEAADAKLFAQQAVDYTKAKARLAQYQLSVGVSEVRENLPTGEQIADDDTGEITDVLEEIVTQAGIDPLPATVEIKVYVEDTPSIETVNNPLIVSDNAERAEAQAVVDSTPQPVKDHVNGD